MISDGWMVDVTGELRTDAVFLYGVENMSTKDVFKYFEEFGPSSVEWIDDVSCKYTNPLRLFPVWNWKSARISTWRHYVYADWAWQTFPGFNLLRIHMWSTRIEGPPMGLPMGRVNINIRPASWDKKVSSLTEWFHCRNLGENEEFAVGVFLISFAVGNSFQCIVICCHFVGLVSLFQGHVASGDLPLTRPSDQPTSVWYFCACLFVCFSAGNVVWDDNFSASRAMSAKGRIIGSSDGEFLFTLNFKAQVWTHQIITEVSIQYCQSSYSCPKLKKTFTCLPWDMQTPLHAVIALMLCRTFILTFKNPKSSFQLQTTMKKKNLLVWMCGGLASSLTKQNVYWWDIQQKVSHST